MLGSQDPLPKFLPYPLEAVNGIAIVWNGHVIARDPQSSSCLIHGKISGTASEGRRYGLEHAVLETWLMSVM